MTDKRAKTTIIAGVIAGAAAVWMVNVFVKSRYLHIEEVEAYSPVLPAAFEGTRVVFVSDIHAGPFMPPRKMARVIDTVNDLKPDILILGGDNVGGKRRGDEIFYPEAKRLTAALGKFAVLGNHDAWEGVDTARLGLKKAGIKLLENKNTAVRKGKSAIYIAGLEDLWTGAPDIKKASAGITKDSFAILVTHNPDKLADVLPATGHLWKLALSGHTHGGQVTLFGKGLTHPTQYGRRYQTGWRDEHGVPILVSNGVGMVTVPFRLAARPEVHVIVLRKG